ncbi:unnamed protein product [Cyclocybe aegerita]|uniref:Cytochrome P450 n=1 Tax=Cyclocybe aegerita TaxID=1973307 RepID=A0A8S0WSV9_CYCAE|nr:unnamed protein product [Cyclocybe aegerita]
MNPLLGSGVFAADGELWKTESAISTTSNDAINQLKVRFREGYAVDIQDITAQFTLDSATEFLFGNGVCSLANGTPYPPNSPPAQTTTSSGSSLLDAATRFAQAFSEAQTITVNRARFGPFWPLTEFWHDKIAVPMKIVHRMIDPIVAEATASTLTFVIYMLAEYPEVLLRLREEILNKVGSSRRPTYEDIRNMKCLRAVLNETLRLYPVVPFNGPMSKDATTWPPIKPRDKPFYIPANTRLGYTVLGMHRRKDLWGPDGQLSDFRIIFDKLVDTLSHVALEFDPDRFLDDRLQRYLTPNPFIFLPFNAGPRICLGQQFAYNEASFFLVRLLQNFSSITLDLDAQPAHSRAPPEWAKEEGRKGKEKVRPMAHLTMYLEGGLWVKMEEAKTADGE